VLEHQHGPGTDAVKRFGLIRDLVTAAQSAQPYHSTAQVMVIVALWPGLDAVFWHLWRAFPGARDDLSGEIVARIGVAILSIDLERVTAVTGTLLRNLKRDICRDLIGARLLAEESRQFDNPAVEAKATLLARQNTVEVQSIADHLANLAPRDVQLMKRMFLIGETQEEAGRALGLTPDAARKRVQRALKRLRSSRISSPALSHSGPRIGL
jgi:DNA-directed RNA polymerase specialized sigma24 family protein